LTNASGRTTTVDARLFAGADAKEISAVGIIRSAVIINHRTSISSIS
jgi:hypothetical protein